MDRLSTWALKELNGYEKDDPLPPYRVVQIVARGFFVGPLGGQSNGSATHTWRS